MKVLSH